MLCRRNRDCGGLDLAYQVLDAWYCDEAIFLGHRRGSSGVNICDIHGPDPLEAAIYARVVLAHPAGAHHGNRQRGIAGVHIQELDSEA